jgi:hypothetical protein
MVLYAMPTAYAVGYNLPPPDGGYVIARCRGLG